MVIWFHLCISLHFVAPQAGVLQLQKLSAFHTFLLIFQYSLKSCKQIFASLLCSFFYLIFPKRSKQVKTLPVKSLFQVFQLFVTVISAPSIPEADFHLLCDWL